MASPVEKVILHPKVVPKKYSVFFLDVKTLSTVAREDLINRVYMEKIVGAFGAREAQANYPTPGGRGGSRGAP